MNPKYEDLFREINRIEGEIQDKMNGIDKELDSHGGGFYNTSERLRGALIAYGYCLELLEDLCKYIDYDALDEEWEQEESE